MWIEEISREFNSIASNVKPVSEQCDKIRYSEKYAKYSNLDLWRNVDNKWYELSNDVLPKLLPVIKNNIWKVEKVVDDISTLVNSETKYRNDPEVKKIVNSIKKSLDDVIWKLDDLRSISPDNNKWQIKEYIVKFKNIKNKIS